METAIYSAAVVRYSEQTATLGYAKIGKMILGNPGILNDLERKLMEKIARKYLAHFINATPGETANYERLGSELESLNVEMGANISTVHNILGEVATDLTHYEKSASVEPFYARKGSALFTWLQSIIDGEKVLDDVRTDAIEVHLWEESGSDGAAFKAIREEVIVEVVSYGGDYNGYAIPFNLHYAGNRTTGTFDTKTKTFTAAE